MKEITDEHRLERLDVVLLFLIVIGGFLIFSNLGNIYLWQDEAQTAVLAKNILRFGTPRAFPDYNGLVTSDVLKEPSCIWIYQPWIPFYLTALSFWLLGASTFTARLPFALFGLASIPVAYFLTKRLFGDRLLARYSTALLTLSVPFLLHVRQCRYYTLGIFFTLLVLLAYLRYADRKKGGMMYLVGSLALLFHSNWIAFVPVFLSISLHYSFFHFKMAGLRRDGLQAGIKRDIFFLFLVALLTMPFIVFLKYLEYNVVSEELGLRNVWLAGPGAEDIFTRFRRNSEFYIRALTKYVFPLVFFFLMWALFKILRKRFFLGNVLIKKSSLWLILIVIVMTFLIIPILGQRHFRHIIYLLPLIYILEALFLADWTRSKRKYCALATFVVLTSSNLFFRPNAPKFRLFDFIYELTHDYDCPVEGIVKFLNANAKPGDTVKAPYDFSPILFYTNNLNVEISCGEVFLKNETYPEWIIYRKFWVPSDFFQTQYYKNIQARYEKIIIDYPDIKWSNMPDPGEHRYRTELDHPDEKVIIYRRRD